MWPERVVLPAPAISQDLYLRDPRHLYSAVSLVPAVTYLQLSANSNTTWRICYLSTANGSRTQVVGAKLVGGTNQRLGF